MHEIFDEYAPVVKLVELYASGEPFPLCVCCPARLVGPGCALPLCMRLAMPLQLTFWLMYLFAQLHLPNAQKE